MNLYIYRPDVDNFDSLKIRMPQPTDDEWFVHLHEDLTPRRDGWQAPPAQRIVTGGRWGDFPHCDNFGPIPVMSERAWNAIRTLVGDRAEALPLKFEEEGQQYYLIHVLDLVPAALDIEQSQVTWSEDRDYIFDIDRYAFRPNSIDGHHMFRLPASQSTECFVSDTFRQAVEANKLTGLKFRPLDIVGGTPQASAGGSRKSVGSKGKSKRKGK